ncbi:hypothetical protein JTE90_005183 [Oedothorax gibbosus]|uniref:Uncharacterized protein n=1 Tax=Oedothorax gibbosus TaxID=931172 RepID=A0AAV6UHV4_9ARAC|nr:hypothetical protein JTE90_005183 [Oedothorax gibbosus]
MYASSPNVNNRELIFTPEVRKINRLGDMNCPKIIKSPSWPSTPTIKRSEFKEDRSEPSFYSLERRRFGNKVSDEEFRGTDSCFGDPSTREEAFKEIHSILSSMDLAKYYLRGPRDSSNNETMNHSLRRSLSVQPHTINSDNSLKKSFLSSIPPSPKTKSFSDISYDANTFDAKEFTRERIYSLDLSPVKNSRKQVNSKLKELTERLRPSSAPPSPHRKPKYAAPKSAPPSSNFSFWMEPLSNDSSFNLKTLPTVNLGSDLGLSFEDVSKIKLSKIPKPARKNNIAASGFATLPRRKTSEVISEPRTLASLDLNINFDSHRINRNRPEDIQIIQKKQYLNRENIEMHNKKERKEAFENTDNDTVHKTKSSSEDEGETFSRNSSRRGSIKSNSSSSKKTDFDLNFSKYGSLSRVDRKKNTNKKDNSSLESLIKPQFKKSSLIPVSRSKDNLKTETIIFEGNIKENKYNGTIDIEEREFVNKSCMVENTKTAPAVPSSFSNPLEEEIRTIAKLLDGKESLFLKLIQSSKFDNERNHTSLELSEENETGLSFDKAEICLDSQETVSKNSTYCNVDRNSPTRLRAMTVPVTETNRNAVPAQKCSPPQQKRFYKKRLRGPYGEMLEQEMSKSFNKPRPSYAKDLDFLKELETLNSSSNSSSIQPNRQRPILRSSSHSLDETHSITVESSPKRKTSANIPVVSDNDEEGSLCVPPVSVSGTVSETILHIRSHSDSVKTSGVWSVDNLITKALKHTVQQVSTKWHVFN